MLIINNLATQDDYADALTLDSPMGPPGGRLVYVVANQSVLVQIRPPRELGGAEAGAYGPELLLTPQSSFYDKVGGARFRSAISGSPARVVAQLSEPGDPIPASGTPFTATLLGSGATLTAVPTTAFQASTARIAVTGVQQDVTGASIAFDVVGSSAELLVVLAARHLLIGAAAAGTIISVQANLDGVNIGGRSLYEDTGGANQSLCIPAGARVAPLTVGAHTLKLVCQRIAGAGANWNIENVDTFVSMVLIDK